MQKHWENSVGSFAVGSLAVGSLSVCSLAVGSSEVGSLAVGGLQASTEQPSTQHHSLFSACIGCAVAARMVSILMVSRATIKARPAAVNVVVHCIST